MRDAVICAAVRTPVGKRAGALSGVHAVDLSAHVLDALVERTGIDPAVVDDVFRGCVSQVGEQAGNVGRQAVVAAGWPESVPGTTIDRQCGSSQQAVAFAAATVVSGAPARSPTARPPCWSPPRTRPGNSACGPSYASTPR